MTENNSFGGFFGSKDPDLNIPVKGTSGLSPYMNLDPRLIQDNDNYILSDGAGGHQRGKFERAFAQIGGFVFGAWIQVSLHICAVSSGSILFAIRPYKYYRNLKQTAWGSLLVTNALGAFAGSVHGLYTGINETKSLGTLKDSVRRTQILNFVTKQGASSAQALGTIGFMFSAIDTCLSLAGSPDEDVNTVVSGVATGVLYKSTAGFKGLKVGFAAGLGISLGYTLLTSHKIWSNY